MKNCKRRSNNHDSKAYVNISTMALESISSLSSSLDNLMLSWLTFVMLLFVCILLSEGELYYDTNLGLVAFMEFVISRSSLDISKIDSAYRYLFTSIYGDF